MLARLGASSLFLGGFGSVAYASTIIDIDIPDNNHNKSFLEKISETQKKDYSTRNTEKMTIEDVEMFQEHTGCRLVFADNFAENKNYTIREWFNRKTRANPKKDWRAEFASGVHFYKHNCKLGGILTLEPQGQYGYLKPKLVY